MAQNQTQPTQTTQIAISPWFELSREVEPDTIRLIAKYVDRFDKTVYAMRIFELCGDALRMRAKWNMPETKGERVLATVKLEDAEQWRHRMLSVETVKDFERLMWELDEIILKVKE